MRAIKLSQTARAADTSAVETAKMCAAKPRRAAADATKLCATEPGSSSAEVRTTAAATELASATTARRGKFSSRNVMVLSARLVARILKIFFAITRTPVKTAPAPINSITLYKSQFDVRQPIRLLSLGIQ